MAKNTSAYVCTECGVEQPRWFGRCPSCGAWSSIVEPKEAAAATGSVTLAEVDPLAADRVSTGSPEFDRVLGGGLVKGAVVLLSGDPGIGKSTLALQTTRAFKRTLYSAGEESAAQIKLRAERLGVGGEGVIVSEAVTVEGIAAAVDRAQPEFLVVDSIQTVQVEANGGTGVVNQIREATARILRLVKQRNLPALIIGHVTKSGDVAGPMLLEHLVDVVALLEPDLSGGFRLLRGLKNRFGATDEVGLFQMTESGMKDMADPSSFLMPTGRRPQAGSAIVASLEGRRPLLVELQALTIPTAYGLPRRVSTGIDANRLALLLAVLERRGGVETNKDDVYLNSAGGMRLKETAVDLGVIAAVASAARNRALPPDLFFCGEVGLGGEVRPVGRIEARLKEAATLGFARAVVPKQKIENRFGLELEPTAEIKEMLCRFLA